MTYKSLRMHFYTKPAQILKIIEPDVVADKFIFGDAD